jgi:protein gp37
MRYGKAVHWGAGVPRFRTSSKNWKDPLAWNAAAGNPEYRAKHGDFAGRPGFWPVFCASLADVFDNEVPTSWRTELWQLIMNTPNLSWLLVTKRIGNVRGMVAPIWLGRFPDNVRLLITVCNQEEADRDIPKLLALPCKNGVSYEPALGPVDWSPWVLRPRRKLPSYDAEAAALFGPQFVDQEPLLNWIIVGGESTQGSGKARPFDLAWARSTIAQCKAASVPVFVKQLGSRLHARNDEEWDDWPGIDLGAFEHDVYGFTEEYQGAHCRVPLHDRAGADPAEWPEDLRVQEFPT